MDPMALALPSSTQLSQRQRPGLLHPALPPTSSNPFHLVIGQGWAGHGPILGGCMELSALCWAPSANPISLSPFLLSPLPVAMQTPGPALPRLLSPPSREAGCSLKAGFRVPWAAHKMVLKSLCQGHSMG